MEFVAIIPARGGSKGLPGKNKRMLAGKPLIQHTIEAAHNSGIFGRIAVSSDDDDILALAEKQGASALRRVASQASDTATMSEVVAGVHETSAADDLPIGDAFVLLQPTSPMRNAGHISKCVKAFGSGSYASAISVCRQEYPPQKALTVENGFLEPLFGWESLQANRQTLVPCYRQNGAIWIVTWEAFLSHRRFVVAPAMPFFMSEADSLDIDTLADFNTAETLFLEQRHA